MGNGGEASHLRNSPPELLESELLQVYSLKMLWCEEVCYSGIVSRSQGLLMCMDPSSVTWYTMPHGNRAASSKTTSWPSLKFLPVIPWTPHRTPLSRLFPTVVLNPEMSRKPVGEDGTRHHLRCCSQTEWEISPAFEACPGCV